MIETIVTPEFLSDHTTTFIPHAARLNTAMQMAFRNLSRSTLITSEHYISSNLEMVTSEDFAGLFGKDTLPLEEVHEKICAMEAELNSLSCDALANMLEYVSNLFA